MPPKKNLDEIYGVQPDVMSDAEVEHYFPGEQYASLFSRLKKVAPRASRFAEETRAMRGERIPPYGTRAPELFDGDLIAFKPKGPENKWASPQELLDAVREHLTPAQMQEIFDKLQADANADKTPLGAALLEMFDEGN